MVCSRWDFVHLMKLILFHNSMYRCAYWKLQHMNKLHNRTWHWKFRNCKNCMNLASTILPMLITRCFFVPSWFCRFSNLIFMDSTTIELNFTHFQTTPEHSFWCNVLVRCLRHKICKFEFTRLTDFQVISHSAWSLIHVISLSFAVKALLEWKYSVVWCVWGGISLHILQRAKSFCCGEESWTLLA